MSRDGDNGISPMCVNFNKLGTCLAARRSWSTRFMCCPDITPLMNNDDLAISNALVADFTLAAFSHWMST